MKLMILDGNSIVNRAFYGIRMLNAPDGTPTNGVYGFLSILRKLLDDQKPEAVCVAFDLKAPTFRHMRYEGYKAQRKAMPEELAVQMPILKQVLDAMGVLRLELESFEADDLLGTVAAKCRDSGWECRIVTGDKDSFQLISDTTHVCHVKSRMGQTTTTEYTPELFLMSTALSREASSISRRSWVTHRIISPVSPEWARKRRWLLCRGISILRLYMPTSIRLM